MNSTRLSAVFVVAVLLSVIHAVAQVTGGGTKGTIPVWTGPTSLGDSVIVQKSGSVAIGARSLSQECMSSPPARLSRQ
jgi:hypothetical protein